MDLSTVRLRLLEGEHENPQDFARDNRLIFSNSKNFNTNKHSQVSLIFNIFLGIDFHRRGCCRGPRRGGNCVDVVYTTGAPVAGCIQSGGFGRNEGRDTNPPPPPRCSLHCLAPCIMCWRIILCLVTTILTSNPHTVHPQQF